ncbi:MAG: CRISPR-associated helicase Cas3' [Christensenellales bacterium]
MLNARYDKTFQRSQTLAQHCHHVAQKAEENMSALGLPALGRLGGLLHDVCKSMPDWQHALAREQQRFFAGSYTRKPLDIPHAPPSARAVFALFKDEAREPVARLALQVLCMAIGTHHGYLMDVLAPDGTEAYLAWISEQNPNETACLPAYLNEVADRDTLCALFKQATAQLKTMLAASAMASTHVAQKERKVQVQLFLAGLLQRALYAAVIDADRLDAARFDEGQEDMPPESPAPDWGALLHTLENRLAHFDNAGPINRIRTEISLACSQAALWPDTLLALHAPTGGGKTLASLRYALRCAQQKHRCRIFYVVSYTTILDQVYDEYLKTFKDSLEKVSILLHHSNLIPDETPSKQPVHRPEEDIQMLAERWDADIILTTQVQFFNALYLGTGRAARRLRALQDAVIILDEVQTIPPHLTHLFNLAVLFLTKVCRCDVMLSSATQPTLHKLPYPIPEPRNVFAAPDDLFERMRRVYLVDDRSLGSMDARKLAAFALSKQQEWTSVLMVLNTRSAARKAYDQLKEMELPGVQLHLLSNDLCPAHRKEIIKRLKNAQHEPVICISTQLIECGVDLSFGCAIRSLAGADNIWQTAGRCNRHGGDALHPVFVVHAADENLSSLKEIEKAQKACTKVLLDLNGDIDALQQPSQMARYYPYLFHEYKRDNSLSYNVTADGGGDTLISMLSDNARRKNNLAENNNGATPRTPIYQAFATAGAAFQAIDSKTTALLVPYKDGARIILDLNGQLQPKEEVALLRRAQLYAINVYDQVLHKLRDEEAFYTLPCGAYALKPEWYDSEAVGLRDVPVYDVSAFMK